MTRIVVHQELVADPVAAARLCPFGAIELAEVPGSPVPELRIGAGCRFCSLCVKKGPPGAFEAVEDGAPRPVADKTAYRGVAVYVEYDEDRLHPVSLELIGKGRSLADKVGQRLVCVLAGHGVAAAAEELLHYGVDEVRLYDDPALEHFRIEPYAAVFEDFLRAVKPAAVLVGGTTVGRSLAPRLAARFGTGLTADCTSLDIREDTDLDQIRPAFGGNIMAHILTSRTRPQFATVRYKIFDAPARSEGRRGEVVRATLPEGARSSAIRVLAVEKKARTVGLEDAELIVVAGRGLKKREDLAMVEELAGLLGAQVAGTRPLIEAGWIDPRRQIGLSGRTVKPKLLLTFGVSGSVQFVAGMGGSQTVFAVNSDGEAPIFRVASYAVVGDLYGVLPALIAAIKAGGAGAEVSA